jgi:hypothetical protein
MATYDRGGGVERRSVFASPRHDNPLERCGVALLDGFAADNDARDGCGANVYGLFCVIASLAASPVAAVSYIVSQVFFASLVGSCANAGVESATTSKAK